MEFFRSIAELLNKGEIDETEMEKLTVLLKDVNISSEVNESKEETSSRPKLKELALKSAKFYWDKIGLPPIIFAVSYEVYTKLGQFDYGGEENTENLKLTINMNPAGNYWIYIGQFKDETKIKDGIGIMVWDHGLIYEGYWKNDKQHGLGRYIWPTGDYYIGQFQHEKYKGNGEYHSANGKVYRGEFENEKPNGYGTLTYPDGTEVTGNWKDGDFIE